MKNKYIYFTADETEIYNGFKSLEECKKDVIRHYIAFKEVLRIEKYKGINNSEILTTWYYNPIANKFYK